MNLDQVLAAGPPIERDAWSLGDAELELALAEIAAGRTRVAECGSGASTIAIARALRERGAGSVHSLEHDAEHAALARARIAAEGLGELATVIEAPLAADPLAQPGCRWYARAALAALPGAIDLLLVDGPPASPELGLGRSRYPALPLLGERLVPGATVIADDAGREGERWVIERWSEELGLHFERHGEAALARIGAG